MAVCFGVFMSQLLLSSLDFTAFSTWCLDPFLLLLVPADDVLVIGVLMLFEDGLFEPDKEAKLLRMDVNEDERDFFRPGRGGRGAGGGRGLLVGMISYIFNISPTKVRNYRLITILCVSFNSQWRKAVQRE